MELPQVDLDLPMEVPHEVADDLVRAVAIGDVLDAEGQIVKGV